MAEALNGIVMPDGTQAMAGGGDFFLEGQALGAYLMFPSPEIG